MLFNSINFMVFFPVSVLGYYLMPKRIRHIWLLLCSYYFYMSWNPQYALLILTSTAVTYLCGRLLGSGFPGRGRPGQSAAQKKKLIVIFSIIINMGILGFFKYSNFAAQCLTILFAKAGVTLNIPKVDVLLPVGISFYTFQALSYTIDVYRETVEPEKNFFKYALFVSFFPQLVAGPIERPENLLAQIHHADRKTFSIHGFYHGILYMLWGLFLKMVIADRIALLVGNVFTKYYLYGGIELIAGAVAFAFQVYCDFASYSTIAVGTAEVLGFSLTENLNSPYLAVSIKDFWRRWHISLSTWFKDYLYIPLGGNRCTKARNYLNLLVTFLASGLWHGAAMTYVAWGGIHGLYQIAGDILKPFREKLVSLLNIKTTCFSYRLGQILGTFILTDFAWIFFRSDSIHAALSYVKRIFLDFNPWALSDGTLFTLGLDRVEMNILMLSLLVLFLSDLLKYKKGISIIDFVLEQNAIFQYIAVTAMVLALFIYGAYESAFDAQAFIYFQF